MIHGGRHQVEGKKAGGANSPSGERLTCEGTGHVAGNEWMVGRRENHAGQKDEVDE